MFSSLNKTYPFNDDLKLNLKSIFGVALGIFLFLLFLQPLNPEVTDFNKKLLIIAGFGMIVLLLLLLLRIVIPAIFPHPFSGEKWTIKKEVVLHFIFLILNSVAFSFYARYVGKIGINFHIAVNIILISFMPVAALVIIYEYNVLRKRLSNAFPQSMQEVENINGNESSGIEFESENQLEHFFLFPEQIILIKAANNYIEIIFKQTGKVSRRLIRNTLKNTEHLVHNYPSLIRVHRSTIVNIKSIRKIDKGTDGLKLFLYDYPKAINVSRQYVLNVKQALQDNEK